jgi:hypothetical protein
MDPVYSWTITVFLTGLLVTSGGHKLSSPVYYQDLIRKYIPVNHVTSIVLQYGLGIIEIGVGFLLLNPGSRSLAAVVAAFLFFIYLALIASSLIRGIDMDCGCSGPLGKQKVSPWLLSRNSILIVLSASLALPLQQRATGMMDIIMILCACFVTTFIYISCEKVLVNQQKLNQLRGL